MTTEYAEALQILTDSKELDFQGAGQLAMLAADLQFIVNEAQFALDNLRNVRNVTNPIGRNEVNALLGAAFRFSSPGASGTLTSKAARSESAVQVLRERISLTTRIAQMEA